MGPHDEWWLHTSGCRQWFRVRRDTRNHDILGSAAPGATLAERPR
jgi:sarcosine oxidase subunit delta